MGSLSSVGMSVWSSSSARVKTRHKASIMGKVPGEIPKRKGIIATSRKNIQSPAIGLSGKANCHLQTNWIKTYLASNACLLDGRNVLIVPLRALQD